MYEIKVKSDFSSAHNLRNYKGKCEHLHGHNWFVEAVFSYERLDSEGMAIDFKDARSILKSVIEDLDHSYLNDLDVFKETNPTSENIAKLIFDRIIVKNKNIKSVSIWENKDSCATYSQ